MGGDVSDGGGEVGSSEHDSVVGGSRGGGVFNGSRGGGATGGSSIGSAVVDSGGGTAVGSSDGGDAVGGGKDVAHIWGWCIVAACKGTHVGRGPIVRGRLPREAHAARM